jgi:CDP-paratose 2-epimerase
VRPDLIVHTAAQPSHDLAASRPFDDFDTNAVGTLNLLEATRRAKPDAVFVHMSTNKVYGDRPNTIALRELPTRWDYADPAYGNGIPEDFSIDQSKHSLFEGRTYKIFGYKGKQVRDNIHSRDVARFIEAFLNAPRVAEVYNIGGGRANSCSILEAFERVAAISGKTMNYEYVDKNREGDHICYISDLRKMYEHFPNWRITESLDDTFVQIVDAWRSRGA